MSDSYAALRHQFVRSFSIGRFAAIGGWPMIDVAVGHLLIKVIGWTRPKRIATAA